VPAPWGVTAGASAPEVLVQEVIDRLREFSPSVGALLGADKMFVEVDPGFVVPPGGRRTSPSACRFREL
jgi:hypothetical protein